MAADVADPKKNLSTIMWMVVINTYLCSDALLILINYKKEGRFSNKTGSN